MVSRDLADFVPTFISNMASSDGVHYIELCKNPIRFDPVSKATNVFYDDANQQV